MIKKRLFYHTSVITTEVMGEYSESAAWSTTRYTLKISEISDLSFADELKDKGGRYTKEHASGWTITGDIHIRSYFWVDNIEATHPEQGWLKGDFGGTVKASSHQAYCDFDKHHRPVVRDYGAPDWKVRK